MELTRTYYFDGELLEAADFIRDQQYFRDVTLEINKSLYTQGVASGLVLSIDGDGDANVSSGLAFDAKGMTLVLADETSLPSPDNTQEDGTYFVVLKYSDSLTIVDETDSDDADLRSSHIIYETPVIDISQQSSVRLDDIVGVILGVVTVKDQTITATSATGRQVTTLIIQGAAKVATEAAAVTTAVTARREAAPPPPVPPSDAEPIADALATLRSLTGVAFTGPDGRLRLSVRAREVEAALPALVRTDAEGANAVAAVELVGLLVEAVKTLAARVEQLERQGTPPASKPEG